jgi:AcrR family transcriptional regulator
MRRLAARLGISTMSLYTYVPGKAELLDLMVDRAYAGMDRPPLEPLTWRQRVTAVAGANWALAGAHPWLAEVATTRPGLGPGATAKYEWELGAFEGLGLDDVERDSWLTLLLTVVRGAALLAVEAARAREASGMDDAAWWRQAGPVLAAHLTPEAYPLAARVGTAVGMRFDAAVRPEHVFRFGLARILDALSTRDVGTDS